MPVITTASLDDTLPKFIADAELTLSQPGVMMPLVDNVKLSRGSGLTFNRPTWTAVTVVDLTQGIDLAQAQSVTDSNTAIAVAEIGGQIFFSDMTEMALREDVMRFFGKALADEWKQAVDVDLTEDIDSAATSLGGAGTTMLIGRLLASVVRLQNATRPAQGAISVVLHPFHYHAIAGDLAALTSGRWTGTTGTPSVERFYGSSPAGLAEDIIRNYHVAELGGVRVYTDPNIAVDSSDDAKGGIFTKRAIISIMYEAPSVRVQRDESLRGVELNYVGIHGSGMYDTAWAFEYNCDASTPTV